MALPTFDQFIAHVLRHLAARPDGAAAAEVFDAAAALAGLTDDDKAEALPGGGAVYKSRIGWAHDRLKRAGLSSSPRTGIWQLTPEGVALARRSAKLEKADVDRITNVLPDARLRAMPIASPAVVGAPHGPQSAQHSPDDRIEAALKEIRESVARDLLEGVALGTPAFFERVVVQLLTALGYRARRGELLRVGGDALEGTVALDALGLARVFVHATRSAAPIGAQQVQTFCGAIHAHGAPQGVLVTTSTFARDARVAEVRGRGSIALVDGAQLADLMIQHCVGVTTRTIAIPVIDGEFFEGG